MEFPEELFDPVKMSYEKKPGCLGYIWGGILPSYIGTIVNQYKDPHRPTSIMESRRVFFVAQMS